MRAMSVTRFRLLFFAVGVISTGAVATAQDVTPPASCCCPPEAQGPAIIGQLSLDGEAPTSIYGFSVGGAQQGGQAAAVGAAVGRFVTTDFVVVKLPDAMSTVLLKDAFRGERIREVVIQLFAGDSTEALSADGPGSNLLAEYRLRGAIVTSLETRGGSPIVTETVAFRAERFNVTIQPATGGSFKFGWDFQRGTEVR